MNGIIRALLILSLIICLIITVIGVITAALETILGSEMAQELLNRLHIPIRFRFFFFFLIASSWIICFILDLLRKDR